MHNFSSYFKKIYVINLDRRPERYKEFLSKIPFDSDTCQRFSAIDGKNIKHHTVKENPFVMACHQSHKTIFQMCIDDDLINDEDLILIFEDDVFFSEAFEKELNTNLSLIKELPPNFILYIGGRFVKSFKPTSLNGWNKVTSTLYHKIGDYNTIKGSNYDRTTHSYILTKYACKEIIEKTKHIASSQPIDSLLNNIRKYVPDMKLYDIFPHLCYSPINYKTVIQSYVTKNYSNWFS